ncbi:MAG: hypothetical protein HOK41_07485 [Nitrospina sp.]|nr:hypothetical protein [Nitrospina sp.]
MGLSEHVDLYSEEVLFGKRSEEIAQSWLMELLQLLSGEKTFSIEKLTEFYRKQGLPAIHDEFMLWKRWPDN